MVILRDIFALVDDWNGSCITTARPCQPPDYGSLTHTVLPMHLRGRGNQYCIEWGNLFTKVS